MRFNLKVLGFLFFISPSFAFAVGNVGFDGLNSLIMSFANGVVRSTGYMMFTLAVVAFFFGIVQFIWASRQGSEGKGIQRGKQFMMWGLIGLFVMFSVWGIVKFAQGVFGIQGDNTIIIPSLSFKSSGTNGLTAAPSTISGWNTDGTRTNVNGLSSAGSINSGSPCAGKAVNDTCTTQSGRSGMCEVSEDGSTFDCFATAATANSSAAITGETVLDILGKPVSAQLELADISSDVAGNQSSITETPQGSDSDRVVYAVSGGVLGDVIENTTGANPDDAVNKTIWGMFLLVNPDSVPDQVSKFEVHPVYFAKTYAYVNQKTTTHGKYTLGVYVGKHRDQDSGVLNTSRVYATMLHEGEHIRTGSVDQVDDTLIPPCDTFYVLNRYDELGCLGENSYLVSFAKKFWKYDIKNNKAESLYYEDSAFVSGYALKSPEEDISESYSVFIARDKPTGNTVADKKINFFYDYPELVSLRSTIRNNIGIESASRNQDSDGDGVSNAIEKEIGTDPKVNDVNKSTPEARAANCSTVLGEIYNVTLNKCVEPYSACEMPDLSLGTYNSEGVCQ